MNDDRKINIGGYFVLVFIVFGLIAALFAASAPTQSDDSVEIYMSGYDEENAPSVEKTLTIEQLKALATYLNERIAEIKSK